jgi:hypothetical protein
MKFRSSLLLAAAIAGLTFLLSSCSKNYTCKCNIVYSGYPGLPDSSTTSFEITDTKSDAKSACSAQSGTYTNADNNGVQIQTVETCTLY